MADRPPTPPRPQEAQIRGGEEPVFNGNLGNGAPQPNPSWNNMAAIAAAREYFNFNPLSDNNQAVRQAIREYRLSRTYQTVAQNLIPMLSVENKELFSSIMDEYPDKDPIELLKEIIRQQDIILEANQDPPPGGAGLDSLYYMGVASGDP